MADIFISHSGQDNETAAAIGEHIRRERPTWSLFYDKDNIRAGQRWQERLREELQSCRVVLAVLSRNWLGSQWCFAEAVTATFRGKDVIGIETEDLSPDDLKRAPPVLHERQRVRLRDGDDGSWQEILEALDRSGLDPNDWFPIPPNVAPYPGLVAFDEKDAGVFFGRKQEITEYLGILDTLRGPDRSQVLVISGASGSGKSSLLRAGLIPRLRRKPNWVVIRPFEVAREPVRNLLDRLGEALAAVGVSSHEIDLTKPPDNPETLAQVLDEALRRLEQPTNAWVLLPLDQAEALVAGDQKAGDPTKLLLDALAQVLGRRTRHLVVVATIRTEFMPRLEAAFAGPEVRLRQAPLSVIGSLAEIIEKPADRFGLVLEPGLSEQIVEDVRTADALPLLAYTLKTLHEQGGADGRLTLDEYQTLGGVQGAIAAKLQWVLTDPEPSAEEARALQRAFTRHLIRVDEGAVEGERLLRRVAPRASLPQAADHLLSRLIDAGLLITKGGTIELAHERLINDWPKLPLKTWLSQDATDRRLIDQLRQRVDDDTLPDGVLAQAEDLLQRDHELAGEEPALAKLVQRSRDQKRVRERQRRNRLGAAVIAALVLAIVAVFAGLQWNKASENAIAADAAAKQAEVERDRALTQLLAMQARQMSAGANTSDVIERAGALALESIEMAHKNYRPVEADAIEAATSALIGFPVVILRHGRSQIRSLVALPDGRLASGGDDGLIKIWPKDGTDEPKVLLHTSWVRSLVLLPDGRLASGGSDGLIKIWPKDGTGEPVRLQHGSSVRSLVVLPDGRLASGSSDGLIKIWPKDGTDEPVPLEHGGIIQALLVLPDGRLASGGDDGLVKIWPKEGTGEPVRLQHGSPVRSLVVLPDGRLASGGEKGQIKLWPKDGTDTPVSLPQGRAVLALAVLPDGRLASGGLDGLIKLWPKEGTDEPKVLLHTPSVRSLVVLPDGRLASGGDDGLIKLWPKDGTDEPKVLLHTPSVPSLVVLPDGRLASGGHDGQIKLWPKDGTDTPVPLQHGSSPVYGLAVLPDGRLASGGHDGLIKLWPKDGMDTPVSLPQGRAVQALAVLPDGRLASGGHDGLIKIWPKDGTGEPVPLQHGSPVRSLVVLPDGRLASGGEKGQIKLWPKDGTDTPVSLPQGRAVLALAVLPDGRLASGDDDGLIKIWPKEGTGEPVRLQHGSSPVRSLVVLPDGRLASGGYDGQIRLWSKGETGEPRVLQHGSGPVLALAVLPNGRLASGGDDGQLKLWLVEEEKLIAALCLRVGRNLTKAEWARYVSSNTPWQPSCRDRPSNWRTPDP